MPLTKVVRAARHNKKTRAWYRFERLGISNNESTVHNAKSVFSANKSLLFVFVFGHLEPSSDLPISRKQDDLYILILPFCHAINQRSESRQAQQKTRACYRFERLGISNNESTVHNAKNVFSANKSLLFVFVFAHLEPSSGPPIPWKYGLDDLEYELIDSLQKRWGLCQDFLEPDFPARWLWLIGEARIWSKGRKIRDTAAEFKKFKSLWIDKKNYKHDKADIFGPFGIC